jgi:diguanylate cyclase
MSAVAGAPSVEEGVATGSAHGLREQPRAARRLRPGAWLVQQWVTLKHWLPKGQLLPEHVLRRRHRSICGLLWLHVPALFAFGMLVGHHSVMHVAADCGLVGLCGVGASSERFRLKARIIAASFGLVTCSAVLVDLWSGTIEAHFHFFVMIGVLTLYQDWTPFLVAILYTVVHHGVGGVLSPSSVYDNPQAVRHPWVWALIHGGFVLAASVAHVVAWRTNENQLLRDPLTGLPSRLLYLNNLKLALERLGRGPQRSVAVLFLDLDRFKVINDSLGHVRGDELLVEVARRLQSCLRPADTVARLSGDEFTVLLEEVEDEVEAANVAQRIIDDIRQAIDLEGHQVFVGASVGIALSYNGEDRAEDLLRDADLAMYRAKEQGRSRYEIFEVTMGARARMRLDLESELRQALENDELVLHYQPEVSLRSGRIIGAEALVRWEHPTRGLLMPDEFIPVAEETGLILPVGRHVLQKACLQVGEWLDRFGTGAPARVSVNVSGRQLPTLVRDVARVLGRTGLDPRSLVLEITESVMMEDPEGAIRTLDALRNMGVALAIDDFGTGYSSLSWLKHFPISTLKLDKSFVQGLGVDPADRAIAQSVLTMADCLDVTVTAEGIETAEQAEELISLGCISGQGYYYARPQPADVIERLLAESVLLGRAS